MYNLTHLNARFYEASEAAEKALDGDPKSVKARYRRAMARKNMERWRAAAIGMICRHIPTHALLQNGRLSHRYVARSEVYPRGEEGTSLCREMLPRKFLSRTTREQTAIDYKKNNRNSSNPGPKKNGQKARKRAPIFNPKSTLSLGESGLLILDQGNHCRQRPPTFSPKYPRLRLGDDESDDQDEE